MIMMHFSPFFYDVSHLLNWEIRKEDAQNLAGLCLLLFGRNVNYIDICERLYASFSQIMVGGSPYSCR